MKTTAITRDERACDRDPELGPGAREAALELGEAAEQPQVDPFDLDALAPRLERVAELVEQQRYEEQQRRNNRQHDVHTAE